MENDQCIRCKHYRMNLECDAFPDRIPNDIILGEFLHAKRHPEQDNDIIFEPLNLELKKDGPK